MAISLEHKFFLEQSTFCDLAESYSLAAKPLVFICGAGPSIDAGLPDWRTLIDLLKKELAQPPLRLIDTKNLHSRINNIDEESDLWRKLSIIKSYMGEAHFTAQIRRVLSTAGKPAPSFYTDAWSLRPHGILTLNLDRFAALGFQELKSGERLNEVVGRFAHEHLSVVQASSPFVVNLHGVLDNEKSWVFTYEQLEDLTKNEGYLNFLRVIFSTSIVVFYGITITDVGASGQLSYLRNINFSTDNNYWIKKTPLMGDDIEICDSLNVRLIAFPEDKPFSSSFKSFASTLKSYRPINPSTQPVYSETIQSISDILPIDSLVMMRPDEIRLHLAVAARRFHSQDGSFSYSEFARFCDEYDSAIHLAGRVKAGSQNNTWLGYIVEEELGSGVFGKVFSGLGKDGTRVAIKIAREEVRDDQDMLHSFRRGVQCMRILKKSGVEGTARIIDASELPPSIIMDYIDGITLDDAVKRGLLNQPAQQIETIKRIADIIRSCHEHESRVLHRDLRPSNVMFGGSWWDGLDTSEVIVLDFDLSWFEGAEHRDFVMKNAAALGYLAPEQLDVNCEFSPRNTLVDVYGLAMLSFFVITKQHPGIYSIGDPEWHRTIFDKFVALSSAKWKSARNRIARLIFQSTSRNQSERPHLTSFINEVTNLLRVVSDDAPTLKEYWLEEAFCQTYDKTYEWNDKKKTAEVRLPSGIEVIGSFPEGQDYVELKLKYMTQEHTNRRGVAKFLSQKKGTVLDIMKASGAIEPKLESYQSALVGGCKFNGINDRKGLGLFSENLEKISSAFRIN